MLNPIENPLEYVLALREKIGLSQEDAGNRLHVHYSTVGQWERGESVPQQKRRRASLIKYLWDDLRLRTKPEEFEQLWLALTYLWGWEPLSHEERQNLSFPASAAGASDNRVVQDVLKVLAELGVRPNLVSRGESRIDNTPPLPLHHVSRLQAMLPLAAALFAQSSYKTAVIVGSPGTGKSTLAHALAHDPRCAEHYPDGALWYEFNNTTDDPQTSLEGALRSWLTLLEQGGHVSAISVISVDGMLNLLRSYLHGRKYLLVLDNVSQNVDIAAVLRVQGPACGLLATTRLSNIAEAFDTRHVFRLGNLTPDEASTLFYARIGRLLAAEETELVQQILDRCYYNPLAIKLASSYLRINPHNWATLINSLQTAGPEIFDLLDTSFSSTNSLRACMDLSYYCLSDEDRRRFRLLGVMAPEAPVVLKHIAVLWAQTLETGPKESYVRSIERTLTSFRNVGLAEETDVETRQYRFHQLTRSYTRYHLECEPVELQAALKRHAELYLAVAGGVGREDAAGYMDLSQHYGQIVAVMQRSWQTIFPEYETPGDYYVYESQAAAYEYLTDAVAACSDRYWTPAGLYAESEKWLTRSIEAARVMGNPDGEALFMVQLASSYTRTGDLTLALDLQQQALHIYQELDDRRSIASCMIDIGKVYCDLGNLQQAASYYHEAQEINAIIQNQNVEKSLLAALAPFYVMRGETRKSVAIHEQLIALARTTGDRTSESASLANAAVDYEGLGEYTRAIEYIERALQIARQEGLREYEAIQLNTLADIYTHLGELEQASGLCQQAIDINEQLGNIASLVTSYGRLAWTLKCAGRAQEAIDNFERALELCRSIGDSYALSGLIHNLGTVYCDLKQDYRQALDCFRQALEISQANNYRLYMHIQLSSMAKALGGLGQVEEAVDAFHQSLDLVPAVDLPADSFCRMLLQAVALARTNGRPDLAAATLDQYLPTLVTIADDLEDALTQLSHLLTLVLQYDMDEYAASVSYYIQKLANNHNITIEDGDLLGNMGWIRLQAEEWAVALDLFEAAFQRHRAAHNRLSMGRDLLLQGMALAEMQRPTEALERLRGAANIFWEINEQESRFECLTRIADICAAIQQHRDASAALEAALKISQATGEAAKEIDVLINLGVIHCDKLGQYELALSYFRRGIALANEQRDDNSLFVLYFNSAVAAMKKQDMDTAEEFNMQASAMAATLGDSQYVAGCQQQLNLLKRLRALR